jgi:hypothetical protein
MVRKLGKRREIAVCIRQKLDDRQLATSVIPYSEVGEDRTQILAEYRTEI